MVNQNLRDKADERKRKDKQRAAEYNKQQPKFLKRMCNSYAAMQLMLTSLTACNLAPHLDYFEKYSHREMIEL